MPRSKRYNDKGAPCTPKKNVMKSTVPANDTNRGNTSPRISSQQGSPPMRSSPVRSSLDRSSRRSSFRSSLLRTVTTKSIRQEIKETTADKITPRTLIQQVVQNDDVDVQQTFYELPSSRSIHVQSKSVCSVSAEDSFLAFAKNTKPQRPSPALTHISNKPRIKKPIVAQRKNMQLKVSRVARNRNAAGGGGTAELQEFSLGSISDLSSNNAIDDDMTPPADHMLRRKKTHVKRGDTKEQQQQPSAGTRSNKGKKKTPNRRHNRIETSSTIEDSFLSPARRTQPTRPSPALTHISTKPRVKLMQDVKQSKQHGAARGILTKHKRSLVLCDSSDSDIQSSVLEPDEVFIEETERDVELKGLHVPHAEEELIHSRSMRADSDTVSILDSSFLAPSQKTRPTRPSPPLTHIRSSGRKKYKTKTPAAARPVTRSTGMDAATGSNDENDDKVIVDELVAVAAAAARVGDAVYTSGDRSISAADGCSVDISVARLEEAVNAAVAESSRHEPTIPPATTEQNRSVWAWLAKEVSQLDIPHMEQSEHQREAGLSSKDTVQNEMDEQYHNIRGDYNVDTRVDADVDKGVSSASVDELEYNSSSHYSHKSHSYHNVSSTNMDASYIVNNASSVKWAEAHDDADGKKGWRLSNSQEYAKESESMLHSDQASHGAVNRSMNENSVSKEHGNVSTNADVLDGCYVMSSDNVMGSSSDDVKDISSDNVKDRLGGSATDRSNNRHEDLSGSVVSHTTTGQQSVKSKEKKQMSSRKSSEQSSTIEAPSNEVHDNKSRHMTSDRSVNNSEFDIANHINANLLHSDNNKERSDGNVTDRSHATERVSVGKSEGMKLISLGVSDEQSKIVAPSHHSLEHSSAKLTEHNKSEKLILQNLTNMLSPPKTPVNGRSLKPIPSYAKSVQNISKTPSNVKNVKQMPSSTKTGKVITKTPTSATASKQLKQTRIDSIFKATTPSAGVGGAPNVSVGAGTPVQTGTHTHAGVEVQDLQHADVQVEEEREQHDGMTEEEHEAVDASTDEEEEVVSASPSSAATSKKAPAKARKQTAGTKRKRSIVPSSHTKYMFEMFSGKKINRATLREIEAVAEQYWDNMMEDLACYARHAGRKTIDESDVFLLMQRQGLVTDYNSYMALIEEHLPINERSKIIPCATANNKVV